VEVTVVVDVKQWLRRKT